MHHLQLPTPVEMAAADAAAARAGMASMTLMENAGRAVARVLRARFRPAPTLVLCGPGNNGGDGYVAARLLHGAGWPVTLAALAPPKPGGDAALAAARYQGPTTPFLAEAPYRYALVIDALFGAGIARPLDDRTQSVLRAAETRPLIAIDMPSGLDGATGLARGYAPRACLTITFARRKPGHLLFPGRELCGETICADIGLPKAHIAATTFANAPGLWRLPTRPATAHKHTTGHLAIAVGARMSGAARLAAAAARRAGLGLVTLSAPDSATAATLRAAEPGVLVADSPPFTDPRITTWLMGPGLPPTDSTLLMARAALAAGRTLVADAGLLSAAAGRPEALAGAAILTPHVGEFVRLFGPFVDRLAATRAAAIRVGATILLKGPDTVIAAPDGRAAINENAPPWLATGGTGDVLAGLIAALLARGLPAFEAACAGAWLHGHAGCCAGEGLLAEDLPALLPAAFRAAGKLGEEDLPHNAHPGRPRVHRPVLGKER